MKTNMKRLLALILALSMVMSLLSTSAWAAESSEELSAMSTMEPQEESQEETQEETAPEPEEEEEEEEAQEEEPPEAEPEAEGEESEEEAKEAEEAEETETKPKEEQPKPKMKAKKQQLPGMSLTAYAADASVEINTATSGTTNYTDSDANFTITCQDADSDGMKLAYGNINITAKDVDHTIKKVELTIGWYPQNASNIGADRGTITIPEGLKIGGIVTIDGVNSTTLELSRNQVGAAPQIKKVKIYYGAFVAVASVTLNPSAAQTIDVGGKVSFTATVAPTDATDNKVKWSVAGTDAGAVKLYSNEACTTEVGADATDKLTVYAKGESAGSATVTATSNADSEKKASCAVTVNAAQTQTHTHDEISFQPWTSTDSLPTESGSYYLTQDVTLSGTWNVPTGETNLCLNGHSIILSGSGSVISVPEGATLNLYDCDETTHYVTLTGGRGTDVSTTQPNGTEGTNYLKVTGGCITGGTGTSNNGRYYGGGVYVSGTFNMYGGNIVGNTVSINGGGVYVNGGTFEMQGGKITGNTAGIGGGGVYVQDGSFTMTGGNIVGNKTGAYGSGGGVYVNRGSFNLSGGGITGNTASTGNGGGVYNGGTFTMEGGSITGNTASVNGGGVLNEGGTFTMTGGSITGNTAGKKGGGVYVDSDGTFNVSGAPVIKDNTKGTGESAPKNNVYLYDSKITVNGALSGSAEVGVTMKTPGVFTSSADPIKASGYKDCFSSDDSAYTVTTDGNELKLSSHEHDFTYSATGATITATCSADGCTLPPSSQGGTDHVAKLTIAAPTLGTYGQTGGGISAEATVTDASSIKGNATVVYKKGDETLSSAPTNAGTYTASITVGGATASVEYTIAQKEVTVSGITASDKVYDGNTDATLVTTAATVTGKLDGDALTVSATGTFDNANVGENKTVTISELTFGGSSKDNYKLASTGSQTTTTAKITAKAVGLTWSNTELAYTGEAQKPTATATGVVDGDTCTVTVSGEQTNVGDDYTATAASLSNSNYRLPENKTTTFKIVKANAVPSTVTANNRTYDGTDKPLVTVTGEATGGEMQYALGTATEATGSYTTSIPAKTDAGTYYVWYKVKGDGNHNDTEPKPISVTIAKPHEHTWGDWEVTKKATCVAKGEKKRTCSGCKKEEKQEIDIDPANHVNTEIRDAKEATETEEGYTGDTYCKDCHVKLESGKTIPKLEKKQEEKTDNQKEEKKAFTDFRTLRLVAKRGTKSVNLTWRKYADADGYLIYGCECGAGSKMKLLKTIKGNKTVKWTQKKLKKGTYYKYKVVAYKNNKGKKQTLVTSKEAHTVTHDGKTTAVKAVKVNKTSVSLKKGKTFQIKASEVKENKKKKIDHHREIRYESSNKKIATVAKNGKVKGVKKGTATIFVYSETGSYKTVKVTVK